MLLIFSRLFSNWFEEMRWTAINIILMFLPSETHASSPIFCNHFEELQTVLIEVELIINNAPLTFVYSNTIETCLTLNHLSFGRELLYSSNTSSTIVGNLTVLSSTTVKINRISNHFLDRWRHQYVLCNKFSFFMKRCRNTFGGLP